MGEQRGRGEKKKSWSSGIGRHNRFRLCILWVQVPSSVLSREKSCYARLGRGRNQVRVASYASKAGCRRSVRVWS